MSDTEAFIDLEGNLHVNYYSCHIVIPKAVMRIMREEQKLRDRRDDTKIKYPKIKGFSEDGY